MEETRTDPINSSIWRNEKYGRPALIGLCILFWLLIGALMYNIGYLETWQLWNVPAETPPFLDFRLIPGSAESFANGFEPSVKNPFDPREREFNYPALWRLFFYTDIRQEHVIWIGISMIVLFFVAVFLFPGRLALVDALMMVVMLFSPACMFLYERGNVDLIVFFVCTMSVVLASYSSHFAAAGLLFGAALKMFPFFGTSIFLKESRNKFLWLAGVSALMFLLYFIKTLGSAEAAWSQTMRGTKTSYGANVFLDRYRESEFHILPGWLADQPLLDYGAIALAILVIAVVVILGLRRQQTLTAASERNLTAFRMGASIYVGTFLLGNNWDYRLAFLVLVVPQMMEWTRSTQGRIRSITQSGLVCLALSCWHILLWYSPTIRSIPALLESTFVLDEFFNWMLLMILTYLFVVSMPEWVKADLQRILPKGKPAPAQ